MRTAFHKSTSLKRTSLKGTSLKSSSHIGSSSLGRSGSLDAIEAQAWVVLEMHFLSRPHLFEDARANLRAALTELRDAGVADERDLKDRACRKVQMQFGPAPALNDDTAPVRTRVA